MDPIIPPVVVPPANQTQSDLAKVNQEIYEHNVELAIRNRTLSVLRSMDDIISKSLSVKETAKKLIDEVVQKLQFQKGLIALVDKAGQTLEVVAVSTSTGFNLQIFESVRIPLRFSENACVACFQEGEKRITDNLHEIFVPMIDEKTAAQLQATLQIKSCILYALRFDDKSIGVLMFGLDKHIEMLSRAEKDTLKELIDVVAIGIERAQLFEDLKLANQRLKEMDVLKDEFVSIASHELRTPMTAIKSYLWLALNKPPEPLHPTIKKYIDIAYKSSDRLIKLVQDMLTVSRIEAKRYEVIFAPVNLYDVVKQVYDELKIKADERQITFTLNADQPEYMITADKDKLLEVFHNIVGNALKFTPEKGSITITIKHIDKMISVSIADSGQGMAANDLQKLFQKFSRLNHSYSKLSEVPGTGLGLYISKQIIDYHKGTIEVQSELGKGSTFTVMLPDA